MQPIGNEKTSICDSRGAGDTQALPGPFSLTLPLLTSTDGGGGGGGSWIATVSAFYFELSTTLEKRIIKDFPFS